MSRKFLYHMPNTRSSLDRHSICPVSLTNTILGSSQIRVSIKLAILLLLRSCYWCNQDGGRSAGPPYRLIPNNLSQHDGGFPSTAVSGRACARGPPTFDLRSGDGPKRLRGPHGPVRTAQRLATHGRQEEEDKANAV
jgi:hypothetical protein